MKRFILLFLALVWCTPVFSQLNLETKFVCTYGEGADPNLLCMQLQQRSFTNLGSADNAVKKILGTIGLAPNFVMVPCPNIDNAAAVTLNDGFRYIVYDKAFMQKIENTASNDWASTSILAHEIGHHLQGHTLRHSDNAESRKMELEADRFSGFVMQKLGASLTDAQAAMSVLNSPADDSNSTHPAKYKRLNAIQSGWNDAAGLANPSSNPSAPSTPTTKIDLDDLDVERSGATTLQHHDIIQAASFPMLKDSWNAGYNYKAAVYDHNHWYVFMQEEFGGWQAYRRRPEFPKDEIKELWNKNNSIITSLDYYNGEWNLMMTSFDDKHVTQRWAKNAEFPKEEIKKAWDEGFYITEASYGAGTWVMVFNKTNNYEPFTDQMWGRYNEFPKDKIKEYWDKNYFITTLKFLNGQWFLVMSEYSDRTSSNYMQRWNKTANFPMDKLIKNDNEGLKLQSVTHGADVWVTVMNKWR